MNTDKAVAAVLDLLGQAIERQTIIHLTDALASLRAAGIHEESYLNYLNQQEPPESEPFEYDAESYNEMVRDDLAGRS
jgi:hypothetical protein